MVEDLDRDRAHNQIDLDYAIKAWKSWEEATQKAVTALADQSHAFNRLRDRCTLYENALKRIKGSYTVMDYAERVAHEALEEGKNL